MKTIYGAIADVVKTQEAANHAAISGISTAYSESLRRAIDQVNWIGQIPKLRFAELSGMMDAHKAISRQMSTVFSAVNFSAATEAFAAAAKVNEQLRDALNVQAKVPDLSALQVKVPDLSALQVKVPDLAALQLKLPDFAGIAQQISSLSKIGSNFQFDSIIASAIAEAERLEAEEGSDARDNVFAGYEGAEYLRERQIVEYELAKIPDFDSMSVLAKCFQYLAIAVQSQSSTVQNLAVGMAGNLLAAALGQENAFRWVIFFLIVAVMGKATEKMRVPRTRKLLRAARVDNPRVRIVGYPCIVTDRPKAKAPRLGCLNRGAVVTITDKMQGWRQVSFVDADEEECFGWVRSKYLRRANRK